MTPHKNPLEWIVFGASAVLIAAVVVILAIAAHRRGDAPPALAVETGPPARSGDIYRIPVRVLNAGDATAETVQVEVSLVRGDRVLERAEMTIPFVPHRSERRGWVTFRHDPGCCAVVARAHGFNEP